MNPPHDVMFRRLLTLLIPCLFWCGTLAAQTRLNFPRVVNTLSERTGIAIANLSSEPANLTFEALDELGQRITGLNITNPAVRQLAAGAQLAEVAFQIFGSGFTTSSAWVQVESDNAGVVGFFLFFDDAVNVLDGAEAVTSLSQDLVFTETESMLLNLANPNTTSADVSLELATADGQLLARTGPTIPPRGRFTASVASLFPSVWPEFHRPPLRQAGTRSLRVTSTAAVAGFGLLGDSTRFIAGLNGQPTAGGATLLYVPQFVDGGGFSTELSLVNLEGVAADVTLELVGENGLGLGTPARRNIPPRGKLVVSDPAVFGLTRGAGLIEGYVIVTSNNAVTLAGSVLFGDPARATFEASLPFVSRAQRDVVYSQVAQNNLFFTGAAIINLSGQPLRATIDVFSTLGVLVNSGVKQLPARGRDSFVLTELFPGLSISAGYFRVRADQDMASFAIFGTHTLSALSAVPPQLTPGTLP